MPHAYLYGKDLTQSNFTAADLSDAVLTDACLDQCIFERSDLCRLQYGRYADLNAHYAAVNTISFETSGAIAATGSGDGIVIVWDFKTRSEKV
jgi:WD40 repeat protein